MIVARVEKFRRRCHVGRLRLAVTKIWAAASQLKLQIGQGNGSLEARIVVEIQSMGKLLVPQIEEWAGKGRIEIAGVNRIIWRALIILTVAIEIIGQHHSDREGA